MSEEKFIPPFPAEGDSQEQLDWVRTYDPLYIQCHERFKDELAEEVAAGRLDLGFIAEISNPENPEPYVRGYLKVRRECFGTNTAPEEIVRRSRGNDFDASVALAKHLGLNNLHGD
jgi:hypothetical protein